MDEPSISKLILLALAYEKHMIKMIHFFEGCLEILPQSMCTTEKLKKLAWNVS
jgi:hypothetical protein